MLDETKTNNWHVLVFGLQADADAYTLAPGLTLRTIGAPLTVFDLAAAGAVGFGAWALLEPLASRCVTEVESAQDAATTPGYDALNRVWLASTLLTLRGFSSHMAVACSAYSWRLIAGHQERTAHVFREQLREEGTEAAVHRSRCELPRFTGGLLDYHPQVLSAGSPRSDPLGSDDAAWVRAHFTGFNSLAAESEPFRFALEASSDFRFQKDERAAVARAWAGIEALFGISTELVHRLSLYAACLLEPRGPSRRARYHATRKLYGERSKAVHGESMVPDRLARALRDSHDLLRDLLLRCVALNRVPNEQDLDDAVFG